MAELIDKGALVNSLKNGINMTIEFMNNNGADKYNGGFDRLFGQLNALRSYKGIVEDMPTTTEAEIRAKAIDEFAERVKSYVDCGHLCNPTELRWSDLTIETMIDTIAEQLKESE